MKFLAFVFLIISFNAFSCTQEEAIAAEEVAAYANSWETLENAFIKYEHCDDGSIAAGFSESVSNLLAYKWSELNYLKNKPQLYKFVLSHIDKTWGMQFDDVLKNVNRSCPNFAKSICQAVINLPAT